MSDRMTTTNQPAEPLNDLVIGVRPREYRLPASTHAGKVRLAVSNVEQSVQFYSQVIGLAVLRESTAHRRLVELGTTGNNRTLLELHELPGIRPIKGTKRLGLYHTAFLLPTRPALSAFVQHLLKIGVPFGSADHLCSESLYLVDPDGLSVEVYADRDRNEWLYDGDEILLDTQPLDFSALSTIMADSWRGAPSGTTVGHVHLYVGNLDAASRFYHDALGMDIMTRRFPGALFVSAGGYHHHVGLNVWAARSPIASEEEARLLFWELLLPDAREVSLAAARLTDNGYAAVSASDGHIDFRDPWGITLRLVPEAA